MESWGTAVTQPERMTAAERTIGVIRSMECSSFVQQGTHAGRAGALIAINPERR